MIGTHYAPRMNERERVDANEWDDGGERTQVELAMRDPQAFAPLYARYFDAIYRYTYRRLRDPERAADATSQVFLKAIASLQSYRGGSFKSWLFTIAHNTVIDSVRRTKPQAALPEEWDLPDDRPTPEQAAILNDERRELWELLDLLTPEQREVVELRLAGLTGQEIADQTGRGLAATKSLQWRAFSRLKQLLTLNDPINHSSAQESEERAEGPNHAIS